MKITIKEPSTLIAFLQEFYPGSPRTRIKKLLQSGNIHVNNISVTLHSHPLSQGDVVEIAKGTRPVVSSGSPFPVLYEDETLIAVDKPAGIATSSVDGSRNIRDEMSAFLRDNSKGKFRAWVIHRLDKEVSGVLLFAKDEQTMMKVKDAWEQTQKHYYALVEGEPSKPEGTIESWLTEDNRQKVHSTRQGGNAKLAITDYSVARKVNEYTLLDIRTRTGRKNQIRVQLSDIGCPIVGDRKYGASAEYERRVRL
ncbi:MAG TPA: RluA family pseudouridine synthase, partial [Bacteroidales bacterium]|nr:RluA family pseudouridine synthase [Bacteroidales bacterium]